MGISTLNFDSHSTHRIAREGGYLTTAHLSESVCAEEVGSVVTSCARYCAAYVFGMIGMLIMSQVLPITDSW